VAIFNGTPGDDVLNGSEGDDTMQGLSGNDQLSGAGGNDSIEGDDGNDILDGGDGNDTIKGLSGDDTITGGDGIDTASYENNGAGVLATLADGYASFAGNDTLVGIENLVGSVHDDTLTGNGAANALTAGAGNDLLDGGSGEDTLDGGDGDDTIDGGAGNDTIKGLAGDDSLTGGDGIDTASFEGNGAGVLATLAGGYASGAGNDTLVGFENLVGSAHDDTLTGDGGANAITAGDGNDLLNGGLGNDTLDGGAGTDDRVSYAGAEGDVFVSLTLGQASGAFGSDTLLGIEGVVGSSWNDTLVGDAGANVLMGGGNNDSLLGMAGNDTLHAGQGFVEFAEGGDGSDTLVMLAASTAYQITKLSATEFILARSGSSTEHVTLRDVEFVQFTDVTMAVGDLVGALLLQGTSGDDALAGGALNDTIEGLDGSDTLDGAGGDDVINGGAGNDSLIGGSGTDSADYSDATGAVTVDLATGTATGADGDDTLSGFERVAGGAYDDSLTGSSAGDELAGGDGRDTLLGGDSNDSLFGEAGGDFVRGGAGDDYLDGGDVADLVNYTDGNSLSYSDSTAAVNIDLGGNSVQDGLGGNDTVVNFQFITGSSHNDTITGSTATTFEMFEGGAGNDTIDGGAISDTLSQTDSNRASYNSADAAVVVDLAAGTATGGAGDDSLININQVRGSAHDDTLLGSNRTDVSEQFEGRGGDDSIDGRGGFDIVRYDGATGGVIVNLVTGSASDGQGGTDTLSNIEGAFGSTHDDSLVGGNAANGTVLGDGLTEIFRGGAGNDTIDGGQGYDRADYTSSTAGVAVTLNDSLDGSASDGFGGTDVLRGIEAVRGSEFDDTLTGSAAAFESFEGRGGNDIIYGGAGIDRVDYDSCANGVNVNLSDGNADAASSGGGYDALSDVEWVRGSRYGNDTVHGNSEANRLEGQGGSDALHGWGGDDTIDAGTSDGGQDSVVGGGGNDTLILRGNFADYTIANQVGNKHLVNLLTGEDVLLVEVEFIQFADGTKTFEELEPQGSTGPDTLVGSGGSESLDGALGDDLIYGGDGYDTLLGGEGNDTLYGEGDDDTLIGGAGRDTLYGGTGADSIQGNQGSDFIVDEGGNDTIDGGVVLDRINYTDGNWLSYQAAGEAIYLDFSGITGDGSTGAGNVAGTLSSETDWVSNVQFVEGSQYNDWILGSAARIFEMFDGGEGDDTIDGGAITDTLNYTNSNRVSYQLAGGPVAVDLAAGTATGAGTDTLLNIAQVRGSNHDDTLAGSDRTDITEHFEGRTGHDVIDGLGGFDIARYDASTGGVIVNLVTGTANDGEGGNDTLSNIEGVYGSAYNDSLIGGLAANGVSVSDGLSEVFRGGAGNDTINGGQGYDRADYTSSTAGADVTLGGTGNGTASDGLGGTDTLVNIEAVRGSDFNDTLTGSDSAAFESFEGRAGNDVIDGKAGTDRIDFATSTAGVVVNLATGTASDGWGGTDTFTNIENVRGSRDFADSITGSTGANRLEGNGGDDSLSGGLGDDTLDGGSGADWAQYAGSASAVTVNLATASATGGAGTDSLLNIENVGGSSFNDSLTGDANNNVLQGGAGNDTLAGGAGNDTADYSGAATTAGVAVNLATQTATGGGGTDTLSSIENASGGSFSDTMTGSAGANVLEGGGGNDSIAGGLGADSLFGGLGGDILQGGEGGDFLRGGAGGDVINGGVVVDRIYYTDGNSLSYSDSTAAVNVNLSGITGDGSVGAGAVQDGMGGNDTVSNVQFIVGSQFNDTVLGSSALIFEQIEGGAGNDKLNGGAQIDALNQTDSNRVNYASASEGVQVDLAAGIASGGAGNDTLANFNQVRGSGFDDALFGTDRTDYTEHFEGRAGNDYIDGRGGYDVLRYDFAATTGVYVDLSGGWAEDGQGGQDTFTGIEGVFGSNFDDTLIGGTGSDSLDDDRGFEFFRGGAGNDSISGGSRYDRVDYTNSTAAVTVTLGGASAGTAADGLGGTDTLEGIEGVRGSAFNDTLKGSGDALYQSFEGREGNDNIDGNANGVGIGEGANRADYDSSAAGVNVNLTLGTAADGWGGTDTLADINQVRGSRFANDTITGDAAANKLEGQGGNDSLLGMAGSDEFYAGTGVDTVDGGTGEEDTVVVLANRASYAITRPNATDVVLSYGITGENITLRNIDFIVFADQTVALADILPNASTVGNDNLLGTSGDDSMDGLAGNDTLTGFEGNDVLIGGLGNDSLVGGQGDDTYHINVATDQVVELADEGTDTVNVGFGAAATYTLGSAIENATVTSPATIAIHLTGNALNNHLIGNAAVNTLTGNAGDDTLDGGAGSDVLIGGIGDDLYVVSAATDVVNETLGGGGTDTVAVTFTVAGTYVLATGVENAYIANSLAGANVTGNADNNSLTGGSGANTIQGGGGSDVLVGGAGNDSIDGGVVADRINYTDGNWLSYSGSTAAIHVNLSGITGNGSTGAGTVSDGLGGTDTVSNVQFIVGSDHNDTIIGSTAGVFEMFEGGFGEDVIDGGTITDTVNGSNSNRVSYAIAYDNVGVDLQAGIAWGGAGADTLSNINQVQGSAYNDDLRGSDRTDVVEQFEGREGDDAIDGRGGDDLVVYTLSAAEGINADLAAGTSTDGQGGTDFLSNIEGIAGSSFNDSLAGGNVDHDALEFFRGEGGDDTIDGGTGYDRVDYTSSLNSVILVLNDTADGFASSDGLGGADTLRNIEAVRGSDFNDSLTGSDTAAFESFEGRAGNDTINGMGGIDRADYDSSAAGVSVAMNTSGSSPFIATDGWGGTDQLLNIENVRGSRFGNDTLIGSLEANLLEGQGGNDSINGYYGDDTLDAGTGVDTVDGGGGTDIVLLKGDLAAYTVTRISTLDTLFINAATSESVTVRNVEWLQFADSARTLLEIWGNTISPFDDTYTGTEGADSIDGLGGNDSLTGLAGDDSIDGGTGIDTMVGGLGDDIYRVDNAADQAIELEAEGTDSVEAFFASAGTYTLGSQIENAQVVSGDTVAVNLVGNDLDNILTGNGAANSLTGAAGNDFLDGAAGIDSLAGGAGDDIYTVNVAGDVIDETAVGSDGYDFVRVAFSAAGTYTLAAGAEDAAIWNTQAGVNVTGSAFANSITGNLAANLLMGAAGDDTLTGGAGNDTLDGGADTDLIVLTGNFLDYAVTRPTSSDTVLTGAGQVVTLRGVESVQFADITKTLAELWGNSLSNFDDIYSGNADNNLIDGLAGNDSLSGLDGNDTIIGGLGVDTMVGGTGNDTYTVDATGDQAVELADEGADFVNVLLTAAGTYTLGANIEMASLAPTGVLAINLTGNALGNVLQGNAGVNVLSGLGGDDSLEGGLGNDVLNGGAGNDTLNGGLGNDQLAGGAGDDSYLINAIADVVNESVVGSDGLDTVSLSLTQAGTYVLTAGVENAFLANSLTGVNLTGNAENNVLTAIGGTSTLLGMAGNDTLAGGTGNDILDGGADTDTVNMLSNYSSYTVTRPSATDTLLVNTSTGERVTIRNVEFVHFTDVTKDMGGLWGNAPSAFNDFLVGGSGADTFNGLAGNDTITGNAGNDTLIGGLGIDSLIGGTGDDAYTVELATDVVVEAADEGSDSVNVAFTAAGTYVLAANVEKAAAVLSTSTLAINLTGNGSDNLLSGNAGVNTLIGGLGNDTLAGGLGNDIMTGGAGDDSYSISAPGDVINEAAGEGYDQVGLSFTAAGTYVMAANTEHAFISTGPTGVNITGNATANSIHGNNTNNTLLGMAGNDTLWGMSGTDVIDGGADNDTLLLSGVLSDYVISRPSASQTTFTKSGTQVTVTNVENVQFDNGTFLLSDLIAQIGSVGDDALSGTAGADTVDGGSGNDTLSGLAGDDTLLGGVGADRLLGGAGNDMLDGGAGNDTYVYSMGDGTDFIQQNDTVVGGIDTLEITTSGLGSGNVSFTRGYHSYDDLVVNIVQGSGDGAITEEVVVLGFFSNDAINAGAAIDRVYITAGTLTTADDVVYTQAQIAAAVLNGGDGSQVFVGYGSNDSLTGSAAADWMLAGAGNDTVNGGADADIAFGAAGNDLLMGGNGNDTLVGGAGADTLLGNAGDDLLTGGAGNDTYLFGNGAGYDTISEKLPVLTSDQLQSGIGPMYVPSDGDAPLGSETDTLRFEAGVLEANVRATRSGDDLLLTLSGGADRVTISGYFASGIATIERIQFDSGATWSATSIRSKVLVATAGDDEITGYLAGDRLNGLAGNDLLDGREGSDTLTGGEGNDTLTGGTGADRFVLDATPNEATNIDTLTDFQSGVDTIALKASMFSALGSAGSRVGIDGVFLSYDSGTGEVAYDADGASSGAAVVIAIIGTDTHPGALGADFLLI
jgi:Ca2+-binding RTX toxin-like protein